MGMEYPPTSKAGVAVISPRTIDGKNIMLGECSNIPRVEMVADIKMVS
jgi:hypothetical protein